MRECVLEVPGEIATEAEDMARFSDTGVPYRTAAKIRELASVMAAVMIALNPTYEFGRSNLANSDLNITDIMCRAAELSSALGSIRRNSTSC